MNEVGIKIDLVCLNAVDEETESRVIHGTALLQSHFVAVA